MLTALNELGFQNTYQQSYTHKDKGKVLDMHFQKDGTDLFKGWKADECAANLAAHRYPVRQRRHQGHAPRDEPGRSLRLISALRTSTWYSAQGQAAKRCGQRQRRHVRHPVGVVHRP